MLLTRLLAAVCSVLLLASCSSLPIEEKKVDYKAAKRTSTLEIPPDLSAPTPDDRYRLPSAAVTSLSQYEAQRAQTQGTPHAKVLPTVPKAQLVRAGGQRWLSVQMTPEELWPILKIFWEENGFLLVIDDPAAGIMETDWAENRARVQAGWLRSLIGSFLEPAFDASERDKYRTRIERAPDGSTDVFISNRRVIEDYVDSCDTLQTAWEFVPADPELESHMLAKLLLAIGYEEKVAQEVVRAEQTTTIERAKLVKAPDGEPVLMLNDAFDRAWRRVGLALDRVGFTVEDRDRAQGFYYVRYIDPDTDIQGNKKKGWLSSLAFWRSDKVKTDLTKKGQYTVVVKETDGQTTLQVRDKDGNFDTSSEIAERILKLLYEQLR